MFSKLSFPDNIPYFYRKIDGSNTLELNQAAPHVASPQSQREGSAVTYQGWMGTRAAAVIRLAVNPERPRWRSSQSASCSAGGSRPSPSADYAGGCCFVSCTSTLSGLTGKKRPLHPGVKPSRLRVHYILSLCNSAHARAIKAHSIFCLPGSSDGIMPHKEF